MTPALHKYFPSCVLEFKDDPQPRTVTKHLGGVARSADGQVVWQLLDDFWHLASLSDLLILSLPFKPVVDVLQQ